MNYMKLNAWEQDFEICIEVNKYVDGDGLALQLYNKEEDYLEPFADLTVNLDMYATDKNKAFVDTNNFPEAERLIAENKLGKPTGRIGYSGYCQYPEYEFNMKEIEKYRLKPEPVKAKDDAR